MRTTTSLQRIIPSFQLRLADRHLLLRLIDSGIVAGSVLVAMMMWTFFSPYPQDRFTVQFVLENSYWFAVWVGAWLILSHTLDFYERTLRRQSWELVRNILIIELEFSCSICWCSSFPRVMFCHACSCCTLRRFVERVW
ncbi:MAG UNVERIFIED_CONTAM: hypothetical protein LVT10_15075 [Anaerolineae bacterium]